MLCMAEFQLLYLLRYLLLSWRRSQCPGWQGMPDIAHVRQLFSYFFSLLSYQSFLILKFFFLLFFIIIQSENLILSVLKLHQRADHAFEMTHAEWKSTDPPTSPNSHAYSLLHRSYHSPFMRAASVTSPLEPLL